MRHGAFEGPERFCCEVFMDDAILIEPLLGLRPWARQAAYEAVATRIFGPNALNLEKDAVEGRFQNCQTCWGLEFRNPERRITKGAHCWPAQPTSRATRT